MTVEYCNLCNGTGYVREGYDGEAPCPMCGEVLNQMEINGFTEHVCDPQVITTLREAAALDGFNCLDCEEWITGEEANRRMDGFCDECAAKRELDF